MEKEKEKGNTENTMENRKPFFYAFYFLTFLQWSGLGGGAGCPGGLGDILCHCKEADECGDRNHVENKEGIINIHV